MSWDVSCHACGAPIPIGSDVAVYHTRCDENVHDAKLRLAASMCDECDEERHRLYAIIDWQQERLARLAADVEAWRGSAAGYGSDAVEWKIRAQAAELKVQQLTEAEDDR